MVTAIASHRNLQAGDNAPQVHSPHFHLSFSHPKISQSTSHSLCQRGFLPVSPHRAHSLLAPLPLPFHTCLIQFSVGNPVRKEKEERLGSRSCHSHLIISGHSGEAKLAQGFTGSSTICCLKDEDDHRSSCSHTFVSSLSLQGSSSSKKMQWVKSSPFALLSKDNSPSPEKKLWFIAALLNFSLNLIWAQCDKNPCPLRQQHNLQNYITRVFIYDSFKNVSPTVLGLVWQSEDLTSWKSNYQEAQYNTTFLICLRY